MPGAAVPSDGEAGGPLPVGFRDGPAVRGPRSQTDPMTPGPGGGGFLEGTGAVELPKPAWDVAPPTLSGPEHPQRGPAST